MTRDADFKRLVRERMAATGQTYTAARADLRPTVTEDPAPAPFAPPANIHATGYEQARREQERIVGRFVVDGRMVAFPMRRKARAAVLLHLLTLFAPGRDYPEREVNDLLRPVHDDVAFWRRELVDYGYLTRQSGIYRLAATAPERPAHMRQEIPAWEELWLPGYLAEGVRDA